MREIQYRSSEGVANFESAIDYLRTAVRFADGSSKDSPPAPPGGNVEAAPLLNLGDVPGSHRTASSVRGQGP
jgi:hypothetical protein